MQIPKLLFTIVITLFATSMVHAQTTTARRAGLNGNALFEDHDDVYTFPQKALSDFNQNRVKLDLHDDGSNSGTIFSGNATMAWGLALSKMNSPEIELAAYPQPIQTIDAFYAIKAVGGDLGVRLGFASGGNSEGDAEQSNTDLNLAVGYTMETEESFHDMSVHIDWAAAEVKNASEASANRLLASYRGFLKNKAGQNVDLGILASLGFNSATDEPTGGEAAETDGVVANVGAGPVFLASDNSTVAMVVGLSYSSNTAFDDDEESDLIIPSVNISLETPVSSWLSFRGGIGYAKVINTQAESMGDERKEVTEDPTFAVGMTAEWRKLVLDVAINRDFLVNGPFALTGTPTPTWASQVSATYAW